MALRPLGYSQAPPAVVEEDARPADTGSPPRHALARVTPTVVHVPDVLPATPRPALLPPRGKAAKVVGPTHLKAGSRAVDALILSGCDPDAARLWVHWLLLTTCGKTPPKADAIAPELQAILQLFATLYAEQFGGKPNFTSAECALAAKLLRLHGPQAVTEKLNALAVITDPFTRQQGFSFKTLSNQWSRLAAQVRATKKIAHRDAPAGCTHEPRCQTAQEHTQKWLHDATASPSPASPSRLRTTSKPNGPSSEP